MKRFVCIVLFVCIILISGCEVKEELSYEHISDKFPTTPAAYLDIPLPENVFLTESSDEGRFAVFTHQNYEVIQEVFAADTPEDAIRHISGKDATLLSVIAPKSGEYRFAWTAATDEGELSCSALLLTDGEFFYSVLIRCPSALEKNYREEFSEIFAGTELQFV